MSSFIKKRNKILATSPPRNAGHFNVLTVTKEYIILRGFFFPINFHYLELLRTFFFFSSKCLQTIVINFLKYFIETDRL